MANVPVSDGAGPERGAPANRSFPVLLDITRLTSRVGHGPFTGVDRVEFAYLDWVLATMPELHCLARLASGYIVIDRAGTKAFMAKLKGEVPWGRRDLRALLGRKTATARGAAESDLRRLSIARSGKSWLPDLPEATYINVGHSNLSETTMSGVSKQGLASAVLIHDTIPLDWPQSQKQGSVAAFEKKLRLVGQYADLVIANSQDTQARSERNLLSWGRVPAHIYAHLGVPKVRISAQDARSRPYFVAIGTIEPRKNHALLLDIWEDMNPHERPDLHIVGRRGWKNEALFARLDRLRFEPWLHEHSNMDDAAVTTLLSGAQGLLFPSFAEGFGLPSLEAAQLGVPVICGDLAIHHELLGDYPVYADLQDSYLWKKTILEQAAQGQKDLIHANLSKRPHIPTWSEHFSAVNAAVMKLV